MKRNSGATEKSIDVAVNLNKTIRPSILSLGIESDDFLDYYWLKTELSAFCSEHALSTSGSKSELVDRIAHFLRTGERLQALPAKMKGARDSERAEITSSTVVKNYKNDLQTRAFFLNYIGSHFKFTVPFHEHRKKLLKEGAQFTYGDLAQFWIEEYKKKQRDPSYKQIITASCEYNQFTQDFAKNEINMGKGTARDAWLKLREVKGPKTYEHYKTLQAQGFWQDIQSTS